jgi:hypothetical protein
LEATQFVEGPASKAASPLTSTLKDQKKTALGLKVGCTVAAI